MRWNRIKKYLLVIFLFELMTLNSFAGLKTPFNRELESQTNYGEFLIVMLSMLEPVDEVSPPPPINAAAKFYELDLRSKPSIPINGGAVKKLIVILYSKDFHQLTDKKKRNCTYWVYAILVFKDDEKLLYAPSNDLEFTFLSIVSKKISKMGGIIKLPFYSPTIHQKLLSREESDRRTVAIPNDRLQELMQKAFEDGSRSIDLLLPFTSVRDEKDYRSHETNFYVKHRKQLARLLLEALQQHPLLASRAKASKPLLVCLGCGSGNDLRVTHQLLLNAGITTTPFGIEIQPDLVAKGNKGHKEYHLIQGNALYAADLIRSLQKEQSLTLVMAEGLLTRQVLQGPYTGLQVIHQVAQVADIVVIGGYASLLVDDRITNAAGWSTETVMIYDDIHEKDSWALALTRSSQESQMSEILRRSRLRSDPGRFFSLDLSMSGFPITALGYFLTQPEAAQTTEVDLSWSYLENKQMDSVFSLLAGFPLLRYIIISGYEPWYQELFTRIKAYDRFRMFARVDNLYEDDLPTFEVDIARLLGQYQNLPHKLLFFPSHNEQDEGVSVGEESENWQNEIDVSYVSPQAQNAYTEQLSQILHNHQLLLQQTPGDGLCFYHALSQQMGIETAQLQSSLVNHLTHHQSALLFQLPIGVNQYQRLIQEIRDNAWADPIIAALVAMIYKRRVILIYPNSDSGNATVQVYNPDGTGSEAPPQDLDSQDLFLIHNGQGHWFGASHSPELPEIYVNNQQLLSPSGTAENYNIMSEVTDTQKVLFCGLLSILIRNLAAMQW